MISRFGLIRRSFHLLPEVFSLHWHEVLGLLAAQFSGVRSAR